MKNGSFFVFLTFLMLKMNEFQGKYYHNNALAQQADVREFTTSSLYGHFCKIHRILTVYVQILYVISLFGIG